MSRVGTILLCPCLDSSGEAAARRQTIKTMPVVAKVTAVDIDARVVDTGATVTVNQTFQNTCTTTTEAVYSFPLPENASVTRFECCLDGRTIVGVVKEKEVAKQVYKDALAAGKTAGLLEQVENDVFQLSLGNIEGGGTLTTRIEYLQELMHGCNDDEIRFSLLSKSVTSRYGVSPVVQDTVSSSLVDDTSSSVRVSFAFPRSILSISSPSHAGVVVNLGSGNENESMSCANLEYAGALDKEMVMVARIRDMNLPRATVERHPTDGTHAISLTLVPRFAVNDLSMTEIIVLVDRSGSMHGAKIEQARRALRTLLKSVPCGSFFNLVGFGSSYQKLFSRSREYTADSLGEAEKWVTRMDADMGGTEITAAMRAAFESRRTDIPTQVLVLTDGEVWGADELKSLIHKTVSDARKAGIRETDIACSRFPFVRVFTLGIGNDVSHHALEVMARIGGGFAQFVGETEKLQAPVMKMVKACLMPPVSNYKVQWTLDRGESVNSGAAVPEPGTILETGGTLPDDFGFDLVDWADRKDDDSALATATTATASINLFSQDDIIPPPPLAIPVSETPRVEQGPRVIPTIYPGFRFTCCAILAPGVPVPQEITVTGKSRDGNMTLTVPLVWTQGTTLHALAARKIIQDLVDADKVSYKPDIVRLATQYSMASKYTSFVAVDTSGKTVAVPAEKGTLTLHGTVASTSATTGCVVVSGGMGVSKSVFCGGAVDFGRKVECVVARNGNLVPMHGMGRGGGTSNTSTTNKGKHGVRHVRGAMSALGPWGNAGGGGSGGGLKRTDSMEYGISALAATVASTATPWNDACEDEEDDDDDMGFAGSETSEETEKPEKTIRLKSNDETQLDAIIAAQCFDGSFSLTETCRFDSRLTSDAIRQVLVDVYYEQGPLPDLHVFATAIVVALLCKQFVQLRDVWELIEKKAVAFALTRVSRAQWEQYVNEAHDVLVLLLT